MSSSLPDNVVERFLRDMEALDQQQQQQQPPLIDTTTSQPSIIQSFTPKKFPSQTPLTAKKKKPAQPSWIRRKQELQALKDHVQVLETCVVVLEMEKSPSKPVLTALKRAKLRKSAFKEKRRFLAAVEENERLRARLKAYRTQAGSLQTACSAVESFHLGNMAVVEALRIELGAARQLRNCSPQVFELLESRIDARLYELEDALKMMQQPMVSTDTDLIERQCGSAVGTLEVAHTGLFPFDKDTVSTTMWSFFEVGKFPEGELSFVNRRSEDGFSTNTRVTVQLSGGGVVSIDTHAVTKRFAAADDVFTMMTESCSTWTVSIPKAATWRHSTREEASFLLRNYSTDGGSVSQVQTTFRLKPEENADVLNCCPLAEPRAIEEIVIPSFRKLLKARHRFVENALFDAIRHQ